MSPNDKDTDTIALLCSILDRLALLGLIDSSQRRLIALMFALEVVNHV